MKARKVFITYPYWHPNNLAMFQRIDGFRRTLSKHGWVPTLLALAEPGSKKVINEVSLKNSSRLIQILHKINPKSIFSWLDSRISAHLFVKYKCYIRTYMLVYKEALNYLLQEQHDIIFVSYPFMGSITLGYKLHDRTGIPWVADFRDLPDEIKDVPLTRSKRLEVNVIKKYTRTASAVVTVSQALADHLVECYGVSKEKVFVVPNGYNEWDYDDLSEIKKASTFDIIYCGTLSYGRSPELLFDAIDRLILKGHLLSDLRIMFYGDMKKDHLNVEHYQCKDRITCAGRVSRVVALENQKKSAILLSLSCPGSHGILTSKIFEYAKIGRPVVSIPSDNDILDEFVTKSNIGIATDSVEEISHFLLTYYLNWEKNKELPVPNRDNEYIYQYNRENLSDKLSTIFYKVKNDNF